MQMDLRQILGIGGAPDAAMLDHVLGLARGSKVLYVPTASNEDPRARWSGMPGYAGGRS